MILVYECPHCGYMDSDPELAETHCLDNGTSLWSSA
jgi:hypothetical protein